MHTLSIRRKDKVPRLPRIVAIAATRPQFSLGRLPLRYPYSPHHDNSPFLPRRPCAIAALPFASCSSPDPRRRHALRIRRRLRGTHRAAGRLRSPTPAPAHGHLKPRPKDVEDAAGHLLQLRLRQRQHRRHNRRRRHQHLQLLHVRGRQQRGDGNCPVSVPLPHDRRGWTDDQAQPRPQPEPAPVRELRRSHLAPHHLSRGPQSDTSHNRLRGDAKHPRGGLLRSARLFRDT